MIPYRFDCGKSNSLKTAGLLPRATSETRCFDNVSRVILVLLLYGFAWKEALVNSSKTLTGCHRAGFLLLWRWKSRPGWSPPPNKSASDQATGFLDPTRTPSPPRGAGPQQQGEQGVLPNYGITLKPTRALAENIDCSTIGYTSGEGFCGRTTYGRTEFPWS